MAAVRINSSDEKQKSKLIIAAGGIVWKHTYLCPKVAAIHRTRYGGEWCLPKGKPDPDRNETLEETALREVEEETGCKARITGFAGQTRYMIGATLKVVSFWNMVVKGKCSFRPSEEVDQVLWLSPQEAIRILDHHEEKKLLLTSYKGVLIASKFWNLVSRLFRFTSYRRYNRLAGALRAYRLEVERRICSRQNDKSDQSWIKAICKLLDAGELALYENNIDEGWKCFHAAQRMEIFGLTNEELKTKATLLRQETEKLSSWRKKATEELLGPKKDLDRESVYQAALLRDEHYNNQAYKDGLLRTHIITLAGILLAIVLTLIFSIWKHFIPLSLDTAVSAWWRFAIVCFFGLFGGTFSAALKVPTSTKSTRIPELVHTFRLTLLRVFAGGASAIIIYIFAKSQFSTDFFNLPHLQPYTYYAISFAAGFSERLVLKAVESVMKES